MDCYARKHYYRQNFLCCTIHITWLMIFLRQNHNEWAWQNIYETIQTELWLRVDRKWFSCPMEFYILKLLFSLRRRGKQNFDNFFYPKFLKWNSCVDSPFSNYFDFFKLNIYFLLFLKGGIHITNSIKSVERDICIFKENNGLK